VRETTAMIGERIVHLFKRSCDITWFGWQRLTVAQKQFTLTSLRGYVLR